jgi:hypothetical protein
MLFKGNHRLLTPDEYFTDTVAVELHKVITIEYFPFIDKGHQPVFDFYIQIYNRLLIDLHDINRDGPEYIHMNPFGITA